MLINSQTPTLGVDSSKFLPPTDAKQRISQFMQQLQDEITQALADLDGVGKFHEDSWERPEGGGGRSRVLRDGSIFEQAGVNFSEVWGSHLPASILTQRPEAAVPFTSVNFNPTPRSRRTRFLCHGYFPGVTPAQSLRAHCAFKLPLF